MRVYQTQDRTSKSGLGFGYVFFNPISQQYKYYYVLENNMLFDKAFTIASKADLDKFMQKVIAVDLPTNCYLSKPSSGWILSSITNVQIKITSLPQTLVVGGLSPAHLQNSKSINGLTHRMGAACKDMPSSA